MNHRTRNTLRVGAVTASAAVCATLAIAGPAQAAVVTDTWGVEVRPNGAGSSLRFTKHLT